MFLYYSKPFQLKVKSIQEAEVYTAIVELILVESLCKQKEYYLCKSETKEKFVAYVLK